MNELMNNKLQNYVNYEIYAKYNNIKIYKYITHPTKRRGEENIKMCAAAINKGRLCGL